MFLQASMKGQLYLYIEFKQYFTFKSIINVFSRCILSSAQLVMLKESKS